MATDAAGDPPVTGLTALELAPAQREPLVAAAVADADDATVLKPFFFPPLWLARRTAIVETLRREGIRSVADLGCGPGALLQILSIPANSLDDYPNLYPPSPYSTSPNDDAPGPSTRARKLDTLRTVPRPPGSEAELHLRRLVGVDLNRESLDNAIRLTTPIEKAPESETSRWARTERERWEDLRIELYEGGLEVYNQALDSLDAIVATEVIEHLTPHALQKFGSVVLGVYQARTVVVTTPNHSFNPYFVASSEEEESRNRFEDPTGRTTRVFRDSDHRFEWTEDEFQSWAKAVAAENDYRVAFSGVGSLRSYFGRAPIPFPPPSLAAHPALATNPASLEIPADPSKFFATQIATFTRQYPNESERSPRSHRTTPLPFFSPISSPLAQLQPSPPLPGSPTSPDPPRLVHRKSLPAVPHMLVKSTTLRAVPSAGNAASPRSILKEVGRLYCEYFERPKVCLRDIWNQSTVRTACGGVVENLVDAIVESEGDEWDFEVVPDRTGDAATDIVWKGWRARDDATAATPADDEPEDGDDLSSDDGKPYVEYVGGDAQSADWENEADEWGVRVDAVAGGQPRPGSW